MLERLLRVISYKAISKETTFILHKINVGVNKNKN